MDKQLALVGITERESRVSKLNCHRNVKRDLEKIPSFLSSLRNKRIKEDKFTSLSC